MIRITSCIQFYVALSQSAEMYVATSLLSLVGYKSCYCQRFLHIYHYHDQAMSHIVESCPLTKLNGGLSRLHSVDEDAVLWLTNYGWWHAYEKKKKKTKRWAGKTHSSRPRVSWGAISIKTRSWRRFDSYLVFWCLFYKMLCIASQNKRFVSWVELCDVLCCVIVIARHMRWGRQEDAHEFLRYVVDALQRSALVGMSKYVLIVCLLHIHADRPGWFQPRYVCDVGGLGNSICPVLQRKSAPHRCIWALE